MDNCIIEEGVVSVEYPATCHFRYCKFRKAQIMLSHLSLSIIENCEFTGLDSAAVSVEGYPKDHKNWAHEHMHQVTDTWNLRREKTHEPLMPVPSSCSMSSLKLQRLSLSENGKHDDADSIGGAASIAGSQVSVADSANSFDASSFSSAFSEKEEKESNLQQWNSEESRWS
jgi:hypothetical protein